MKKTTQNRSVSLFKERHGKSAITIYGSKTSTAKPWKTYWGHKGLCMKCPACRTIPKYCLSSCLLCEQCRKLPQDCSCIEGEEANLEEQVVGQLETTDNPGRTLDKQVEQVRHRDIPYNPGWTLNEQEKQVRQQESPDNPEDTLGVIMRRKTMEPPIYPKEVNKRDNQKLNYYIVALKLWTQVLGEEKRTRWV